MQLQKPFGPGKNPVRPPERSHVQSMGRHGAPSLTNKLYTMDRAPLLGQGPNSPPDLALVGYLNLLAYRVQINFYNNFAVDAITQNKTQPRNISQFSISQHQGPLGLGESPPEPGNEATPRP